MEKHIVQFNGEKYFRFPGSPHKHLQLYYWPSRTARENKGLESLHREIWKANFGPIPEGFLIHHKDGNKLNNNPSNLECLSREEHGKRHSSGAPDWLLAHLERIRPQTAEWHRSEEGREWHRQHGKKTWEGREPVKVVCAFCHNPFETLAIRKNVRFCSPLCQRRWYAAHGQYDVEDNCLICGKSFTAWKYSNQKTCSRKCAAVWRNSR